MARTSSFGLNDDTSIQKNGNKMLKIESEKITLTRNIKVYINFLSDLNNYKVLFPKDKISDWKSDNDSCSLKVQNVYTLEMIKESVSKNSINLISGGSSPFKFSLPVKLTPSTKASINVSGNCGSMDQYT